MKLEPNSVKAARNLPIMTPIMLGADVIIVILLLIGNVSQYINSEFIRTILSNISFSSRYSNFAGGILDYGSLFYFLSISALFLFLSTKAFERRRWM